MSIKYIITTDLKKHNLVKNGITVTVGCSASISFRMVYSANRHVFSCFSKAVMISAGFVEEPQRNTFLLSILRAEQKQKEKALEVKSSLVLIVLLG